jgi:hypothetical protein
VPVMCPIRWSVRDCHGRSRTDQQGHRSGFQQVALVAETSLIRKRSVRVRQRKSPGWAQLRRWPAQCPGVPLHRQGHPKILSGPLRRKHLRDPPLSGGASAPPPVRNQGSGSSLPGPDAGHPLQGAGSLTAFSRTERTTPDSGGQPGRRADSDLRLRTVAHWPDTWHWSTDLMVIQRAEPQAAWLNPLHGR